MTDRLNCWQFRNCGREKGGLLADLLGVCPVAAAMKHDGVNHGTAAGRYCWRIAKVTPVESGLQGCTGQCRSCEFYSRVLFEEQEAVDGQFASADR